MENVNLPQLGQFLSRAAKGKLNGGESKIIFALLKAALVDGKTEIEYELYNFQVLTGMQKSRVDTALGSLLKRKILKLNKAKNTVYLNQIGTIVDIVNIVNNVKHVKSRTVKPISFNPVTSFVQNLNAVMPHVKLDGKTYLIEVANAKRMYEKFFNAFPWSGSVEEAGGLMRDYLAYKLETDEWFKLNAKLPATLLYKGVDQYIGGMKPKNRDDMAFQASIGRRLSWDVRSRQWGASHDRVGKPKQDAVVE